MREIKFRGHSIVLNRWVYGYVVRGDESTYIVYSAYEDDYRYAFDCVFIEVDPKSIMQFTGLKDKNKVDIYEGDILKSPSEDYDYCICIWNDKNCCFQIDGYGRNMYFNEGGGEEFSKDVTKIEEHIWVLGGDDNIEVIGNIYENAELLNG